MPDRRLLGRKPLGGFGRSCQRGRRGCFRSTRPRPPLASTTALSRGSTRRRQGFLGADTLQPLPGAPRSVRAQPRMPTGNPSAAAQPGKRNGGIVPVAEIEPQEIRAVSTGLQRPLKRIWFDRQGGDGCGSSFAALSNPVDAGPLHRAIGAICYCLGSLWPPACRILEAPIPPEAPGAYFLLVPPLILAESVTIRDVVRRAPATDGHARRSELLRIFDNGLMELLRKVRKR